MFAKLPLLANIALFGAAAAAVWFAGTRIAGYADEIARSTGLGHAIVGLLMLAGVTSLPEVAVTVTASIGNNPKLAVNNLLGSIAMQVAILAIADRLIGRDALTSVIVDPVVLLQLALNVMLLSLFAAAAMTGDVGLFGVGGWSASLFIAYLSTLWVISRAQGSKSWIAANAQRAKRPASESDTEGEGKRKLGSLIPRSIAAGAAILVAGFLLSKTSEAIASQTTLGQSFAGFLLVAFSTSLPEVSTVIASVRLHRYVMAMSDIFGTNLFNVGLVFFVDIAYRGGPVLNEVDRFSVFAALLGVLVTSLFLVGLIERRDKTVARMGIDSIAVLIAYLGGVVFLYQMR